MSKAGVSEKFPGHTRAVPFPKKDWLNTDKPYTLEDLKGKVVILDFWTYCCINCMHVLPDLKKLEERFPNELVVIGVHSAKFENEKVTGNIKAAILRYKIEHPVINDDEMLLWRQYGVRAWPTLVVIDPQGYVVGSVPGEGNYKILEKIVMTLIADHSEAGTLARSELKNILETTKILDTPLAYPGKIIARNDGSEIFVSDSNHNRIVSFYLDGKIKSVIGSGTQGWQDGKSEQTRFFQPQGLALDETKNILYVADTENHLIRVVDLKTQEVKTIAGVGKKVFNYQPKGNALQNGLNSPWDLYLKDNWLFIAMAGPHQIWVLDTKTNELHNYAGTGREDIVDGQLATANFAQPSGLTSDGEHLFVADSEVSAIRSVDLDVDKGFVRTIVGLGLFEFGDKDGKGDDVRLQHALGVYFHDGKLFVADTYNHKIKIIDPKTKESKTFLGSGDTKEFFEPSGLTVVKDKLYIADTNNNRIQVADLKTKKVSTLNLIGLSAPSLSTNQNVSPVQKISLKKDKNNKVIIQLKLPTNLHINEMAPHEMILDSEIFEMEQKSFPLHFKNNVAEIAITLKNSASSVQARVSATIYTCTTDEKKLCSFKKFEWPLEIEFSDRGSVDLELNADF